MIKEIIENYIKNNDIKNYKLIQKYWTLEEWNAASTNPMILGQSVAFVYYFQCIGIINTITDISKPLFRLNSDNTIAGFVDYKDIVTFKDINGAIEAKSDFISIHSNRMSITPYDPTTNMFSAIYSAHIKYFSLTPLK